MTPLLDLDLKMLGLLTVRRHAGSVKLCMHGKNSDICLPHVEELTAAMLDGPRLPLSKTLVIQLGKCSMRHNGSVSTWKETITKIHAMVGNAHMWRTRSITPARQNSHGTQK